MSTNAMHVSETSYVNSVSVSPSQELVKRLYDKIEDLKIVEDILSTPDAQRSTFSPNALKVMRQLQHEITLISQELAGMK